MILLTFVEINDLFSKNVLDLKAFLKSNIAIQLFINVDNLILIKIYSLDNIFFFLLMSFYVRLLTHEFHYVATNYKMLCHMFKIINLHEYIYIYIYIYQLLFSWPRCKDESIFYLILKTLSTSYSTVSLYL